MKTTESTWKGALVATTVGIVLLLAVAEVGLRAVYPEWRAFYSGWFMEPIRVPGYGDVTVGHPGFDGYFSQNNGDFRSHVHINDFGLRDNDPVSAANGRVWIVGDSFAFGWGVDLIDRYTEVMGAKASVPVYNIASPGTDVCGYQALLARMPKTVKPRAVVMGLILENDMHENYDCQAAARRALEAPLVENTKWSLLAFKHAMSEISATYNVIVVGLKRVPIITQTLVDLHLVEPDHKYKLEFDPTNLDTVAASSVGEIVRFKAMLPAGTPFAVLITPGRFEIRDNDPLYHNLRLKTVRDLAAHGIDVVDPIDPLKAAGFAAVHFAHDGHWSALGQHIAGEALADWLKKASP